MFYRIMFENIQVQEIFDRTAANGNCGKYDANKVPWSLKIIIITTSWKMMLELAQMMKRPKTAMWYFDHIGFAGRKKPQ